MRALASSPKAIERLRKLTDDSDPDIFLKALTFAADRGYGKAQQHIDVTTGGESLSDVLRRGRERVAKLSEGA